MRTDLASELLRETYRNERKSDLYWLQNRPLTKMRKAIANSKTFVLDDSMSSFLGELATVPFVSIANERMPDALDSLRHSAIPPFDNMFVQLDNRAFRRGLFKTRTPWRKTDVHEQPLLKEDSDEIVDECGWLIETRAGEPDVMVTEVFMNDKDRLSSPPFRWVYRTNDIGWARTGNICSRSGMFAHGITGYHDPCTAVWYSRPLEQFPKEQKTKVDITDTDSFVVHNTVIEFGSTMRYIYAFLATLNNVPKIATDVKQSRHFIGGGQRRKYQDHTVLTLHLPARQSTTKLARRLIAQARRGWHIVRPHWRIAHDRLGGNYCTRREQHLWGVADETGHATCKQCDARRVWIVLPHGRGDPTLSVRTHKYNVTH